MSNKNQKGGRCDKASRKYEPNEIISDLEGYELLRDPINQLRQYDRIKYIRKDNGQFKKGGLAIIGNKRKGYILIQGFGIDHKTCKPIRFSISVKDNIIFRKIKSD